MNNSKNSGTAKKPGTAIRLIKAMFDGRKPTLALIIVFILISTVANVVSSFFIRILIDDYIAPMLASAEPDFTPLLHTLLKLSLLFAAGIICALLYNRMMVSVGQDVQRKIRDELFIHMQSLPVRYFDTHTHGDLMSRFTNDTDTLREFFAQSLPQIISSVFTITVVSVAMVTLSIPLSLIILVFAVITLTISFTMSRKVSRNFYYQQKAIGDLTGYSKELIHGAKEVKVFCHEQEVMRQFSERTDTLRKYGEIANIFTNTIIPIVMSISTLQYVAIALIGGILAINGMGGVTLGSIAAFLSLSRTFSSPIAQVSTQVNAINMAITGARRIFEVMDEEPEVDDGYVTLVNADIDDDGSISESDVYTGRWAWKHPHNDGRLTYTELRGDVRLMDVVFGYNPDKIVLKDVSLYAKPGQKIAFVGATGAGKTTITNLINRFYDISDGKIRYDGINITKIKKADIRRSLGIVLQDTHLFSGTIADNIRYGKLDASDEEVIAAAKRANAHDFITRLPDGYDTFLSDDGSNFSAGQRQLLAIARAAISNPPVMILDEATSSIDTRTEAIVQRGMDSLMEGRTVLVIAHRLSTVKNANAIMVLEQGRIVERGDHDDLIGQKGKYYQLYTGNAAKTKA